MPKLEDILKSKGYTDADLATLAPMLSDQRFRSTLETEYNLLDTERTTLKADLEKFKVENDGWAKYEQETVRPTLEAYDREKADLVASKASLEARLKLAEEAGFARPTVPTTPVTPPPGSPEAWDPKKHNIPTWDDVNKLAMAEGDAIAMATNLAQEYAYLNGGKQLFDYTYTTPDGRSLNGMVALRQEALAAKAPNLYEFARKKFDFDTKRNAIAEKQKADAEKAIRDDERQKTLAQHVNPETRQLLPSQRPFLPSAPRDAANGKPKMPWQTPAPERRADRLNRILETQLKTGAA